MEAVGERKGSRKLGERFATEGTKRQGREKREKNGSIQSKRGPGGVNRSHSKQVDDGSEGGKRKD